MNKKITILAIILIMLLGLFLRIYGLDKSPPSLNWDEAALGYNAFSLMHTGKDEYGKFLPLTLRSFDDYKSAIPAYLVIPFIAIFGLNEVGVRMVSVIAGVFAILLVFLITKKITNSRIA